MACLRRRPMLLEDALTQFTLQLRADGRSPSTVQQYERHVRMLVGWAAATGHGVNAEHVDHAMLARFMTSPRALHRACGREKKGSSVNALRTTIRCFFAYLVDVGAITVDPARRLRRASTSPPTPRGMRDQDLLRLISTIEPDSRPAARRDLALVRLLAESGMRLGSALALDVQDLDLDAGEAHLRRVKGADSQTVLLPRSLCAHLRAYVGERAAGPVFLGRSSRRVGARQVQLRFAAWIRRSGVRPTPMHSLRHRFAIGLYQRTGDIFLVQQALGHRSIASTTVYARTDKRRLADALGA